MTVYKLFLRITRNNIPSLLLFLAVFVGVSLLMSTSSADRDQMDFTQTKIDIALFSQESTPLVEGLLGELEKTVRFQEREDKEEQLLDALFFEEIHGILRIPAGFTEAFLAGQTSEIFITDGINQGRNTYLEMALNRYLGLVAVYRNLLPGEPLETILALVDKDLARQTEVNMATEDENPSDYLQSRYYFNFLAYSLFAILILGIGTSLLVMNERKIRWRTACAPVRQRRLSLKIFGMNFSYALVCWAVLSLASLLPNRELAGSPHLILFLVNSFILSFWAASISFLIAHLVKSRNGLSAIVNVIAMGTSFLAGVFVPQELLGSGILKAASFTPTYWYVLANDRISRSALGSLKDIGPLLTNDRFYLPLALQLGFGFAFLALALAVGKRKQLSHS